VLSNANYPDSQPAELVKEIVSAMDGDLIQLLTMQNEWAYGKRFRAAANGVSEGVFRLDWVHGAKMMYEEGERMFVEVSINDPDYGFRPPAPTDTASKLRLKRQHKKITDVEKIWNKIHAPSSISQNRITKAVLDIAAPEQEEDSRLARKGKIDGKKKRVGPGACHKETVVPSPAVSSEPPVSPEESATKSKTSEAIKNVKAFVCEPAVEQSVESQSQPLHPLTICSESHSLAELTMGLSRTAQTSGNAEPQSLSPLRSVVNVPPSMVGGHAVKEVVWEPQWEQRAAHLEALFSASGSNRRRRTITVQRRMVNRRFITSLLQAKRSGKLQVITADWERVRKEMVNTTERVKQSLPDVNQVGDLESISEKMADVAETAAAEVKALKERVLHAVSLVQSKDLEGSTSQVEDAQGDLDMTTFQIKHLMKHAFKGMCEPRDSQDWNVQRNWSALLMR